MNRHMLLPALVAVGIAVTLFLPEDAFSADVQSLKSINSECIFTQFKNCKVIASGFLNVDWGDNSGAPRLAWQTQSGHTDEFGVAQGFVLLEHDGDGWSVFDRGFDGAGVFPPLLGVDGETLHLPGYSAGTGAYNVDRLYVLNEDGAATWKRVDLDQWLNTIDEELPDGLQIWKGVDYGFNEWFYGSLTARTPLWKQEDANCCPSGGWAIIHFDIDRDNVLIATRVDLLPQADE